MCLRVVSVRMLLCSVIALVCVVGCFGAVDVNIKNIQVSSAMHTLCRVLPDNRCRSFSLALDDELASPHRSRLRGATDESFVVSALNGTVYVTAPSGVALTAGAYYYLKNVANAIVTWGENRTGDQVGQLPRVFPDFPQTTITSTAPWRYGWNMVTFSYSAVWWDFPRWQREIDWMALHGVNMPLALTGQEYIWMQVFQRLNVSLADLQEWFTGPAFLAWQRAGNIRGFAGPLSENWIRSQMQLQQLVLAQMRSLGMTPVLPCFAGHVPKVISKIFPNATLTQSPPWNNFPPHETDVYYLQPTDSLYNTLGKLFMETLVQNFGTSHYYSCDTFNEVNPTSTDPSYLRAASKAVLDAIQTVDTNGVWVMQAWLFHNSFWTPSLVQAYLSGVPNDKMVILDLNSEDGALAPKYDQYYGKPWIWCMLLNYGGVRGVYGNMTRIATGPFADLYVNGSTMVGIGFTPEAIEQNPAMFELLTDTFWGGKPLDATAWIASYVTQRYGLAGQAANQSTPIQRAWGLLFDAVYDQPGEPRSEIEWVPHWQQQNFGWQNGNATTMLAACEAFLAAVDAGSVPNPASNGPFQYDLVDVMRQCATMFFSDVHRVLDNIAWTQYEVSPPLNTTSITKTSNMMKWIISTIDQLLGTNVNYMLGLWTTRAAKLASSELEGAQFLYNAKNQITMWGPSAQIDDYAAKAWHGLYGTYYLQRWSYYLDQMVYAVGNGTINAWNSWEVQNALFNIEQSWCSSPQQFSPEPTGDGLLAIALARSILSTIATSKPLATNYVVQNNFQVSYSNVFVVDPMWTTDPRQLAILCDLFGDMCAAFDLNGYLYSATSGYNTTGVTTYVATRSTNI